MLLLDSSALLYKKESIYKAMGLEIVYYFYVSFCRSMYLSRSITECII